MGRNLTERERDELEDAQMADLALSRHDQPSIRLTTTSRSMAWTVRLQSDAERDLALADLVPRASGPFLRHTPETPPNRNHTRSGVVVKNLHRQLQRLPVLATHILPSLRLRNVLARRVIIHAQYSLSSHGAV
jgi:hypothetical protein